MTLKIYTKTGDKGDTGLFGGARVSKASERVTAYGEVDELNSVLGVVCAHTQDEALTSRLYEIQRELFCVGAELATNPNPKKELDLGVPLVSDQEIERLERSIDTLESELAPLKTFILPGGTQAAAFLHVARTTCRRAERALVRLVSEEPVRMELIRYVNRLSDLLFVMARYANHRSGTSDVPWEGAVRASK